MLVQLILTIKIINTRLNEYLQELMKSHCILKSAQVPNVLLVCL